MARYWHTNILPLDAIYGTSIDDFRQVSRGGAGGEDNFRMADNTDTIASPQLAEAPCHSWDYGTCYAKAVNKNSVMMVDKR